MKMDLSVGEAIAVYGTDLKGISVESILKELVSLKETTIQNLKDSFGNELQLLQNATTLELMKLGCTKSQSNKLLAIVAMAKKWNSMDWNKKNFLCGPEDIVAYMKPVLQDKEQEEFWVILMNTKNAVIGKKMITKGLIDRSLVHPREVFRTAIKEGCNRIILTHNHPSGDPTPSEHDIQSTRMLIGASRIIGIEILDHVVIGKVSGGQLREYVSFRELGLLTE
jgi:DNA repair protein RadC